MPTRAIKRFSENSALNCKSVAEQWRLQFLSQAHHPRNPRRGDREETWVSNVVMNKLSDYVDFWKSQADLINELLLEWQPSANSATEKDHEQDLLQWLKQGLPVVPMVPQYGIAKGQDWCCDQRRIDQRAGLQDESLALELAVDQRQQLLVAAVFDEPGPKAHQRRLVRNFVTQAQADKAPPGKPVADERLALRVGQAVAMLEQAHLEKHQGRGRRPARGGRIHRVQRRFDGGPVDQTIQPIQEVIGRGVRHETVEQTQLRIGFGLHAAIRSTHRHRYSKFCRGFNLWQLSTNPRSPRFSKNGNNKFEQLSSLNHTGAHLWLSNSLKNSPIRAI